MEALFDNIYVLAAYGFLIYTVLMFVMKKDEYLLADDQAFNIDGLFYSGSDEIAVHNGDRIRLLTAATGG